MKKPIAKNKTEDTGWGDCPIFSINDLLKMDLDIVFETDELEDETDCILFKKVTMFERAMDKVFNYKP